MTTFTDAEAEEKISAVLDQATVDGEARIKRSNGQEFIVRPTERSGLDVGFVKIEPPLTAEEIVAFVREGRER